MGKDIKNNNKPDKKPDAGSVDEGKGAADIVILSKQEHEALKSKSEERDAFYDKFLRAQAEFENAKKRLERERQEILRYANDSFVLEFLPILDNLEIAEKHIEEAKDFKAVREGVGMIQSQMQVFLKDIGVERIKTVGERFNPEVHEALEVEEATDKDDGLIVAELKPGYKVNGRLLRPASVRIVRKKE